MTISVVITTKNRLSFLKEAVNSVLAQTVLPDELIIVDDASDDETEAYCRQLVFPFPFFYFRNATSLGANECRNKGIAEAHGKWVAFLDDDDIWEPEKLACQKQATTTHEIDLVYTAVRTMSENLHTGRYCFHRSFPFPPIVAIALSNYVGITSTMMIRRQAIQAIGSFDVSLPALQDYDLVIRLIRNGAKPFGIRQNLVRYRVSDSRSISTSPEKFRCAACMIIKKAPCFLRLLYRIGMLRIFLQKIFRSKSFRKQFFRDKNESVS